MRAAIGARAIAGGPIAGPGRRAARGHAAWTAPRAVTAVAASDRRVARAGIADDEPMARDRAPLNPARARPARAAAGDRQPDYRVRAVPPEARAS